MDLPEDDEFNIHLVASYSRLLWDTLEHVYKRIGLNAVTDAVFKQMVLARIIEPTSKLETIRVLSELGLNAPTNTTIHRSLRRAVCADYRDTLSAACLKFAEPSALTLVLYDVTTFRMSKSDLKARPIFHHKRDSIEAHLTIVFAALAVAREIEAKTGISIRKFIRTLAPVRTGVFTVNQFSYSAPPKIPEAVKALLMLLHTCSGGY